MMLSLAARLRPEAGAGRRGRLPLKSRQSRATAQAMRVTRVSSCATSLTMFRRLGRLVVREEAAVGSELAGYRVSRVYVDEGDWVKQGQAMASSTTRCCRRRSRRPKPRSPRRKPSSTFRRSQLERAESARERKAPFSQAAA